jgi:uncharacterized protein YabE (DUF348 family)
VRRPRKALYASAATVLLALSAVAGGRAGYKTVIVQDDGGRRVLRGIAGGTVGNFLESQGIHVSDRDRVTPDREADVVDGMMVTIEHPAQVTLVDGPHVQHVYTFAKTWGDVLQENRIHLGPYDAVQGSLTQPTASGDVIKILRAVTKTDTRTQEIPFQTLRRPTSQMYAGQQRVLTYGVKGLLQIQTVRVWRGGHMVAEQEQRRVVRNPVTEVIVYGTRPRPQSITARDGTTLWVKRKLTVLATAYVAGGRTSTGDLARPGVIAVDPRVIPLGSRVYIPGIGVVRAEDTGSAIVGNRIDICVPSRAQAAAWGVRTVTVYVLN